MLKFPLGKNNPARLIYKNYLRYKNSSRSRAASAIVIDILVPIIEKDLVSLPFVIACARKNILNPVGNIYIVGKKGVIEDFCKEHACIFLDEEKSMPVKKSDILFNGKEWSRSGWLFQQLIKLNADELVQNDNVLILDADTCITTKQSFVTNSETFILNFADEYHFPYSNYNKLLDLNKRFFLSFICHHMIFKKTVLRNLKKDIELHTGKNWINAILSTVDFSESSCFSEYELYGNYLYYSYRDKVHLEYWLNKSLHMDALNLDTIEKYAGKYKSISLHKYN